MAVTIIQLARSFYLAFIRMFPLRIVPGGTKRMEGFVKIDKELDELITRLTQLDKDMIDNDKVLMQNITNIINKVNELETKVTNLETKVNTFEQKFAETGTGYIKFPEGVLLQWNGAMIPAPIQSNTRTTISFTYAQPYAVAPVVVTDCWVVNTNQTVDVTAVGPIYHHLEYSDKTQCRIVIYCTNGPECKEGLGFHFHASGNWK